MLLDSVTKRFVITDELSDSEILRRKRIGIGNKGHCHSDEAKQRMSISRKGKMYGNNNPFYGKNHSDESREKNRLAHIGNHHSNEVKKRLSISHIGKHHTEETKRKISVANKLAYTRPDVIRRRRDMRENPEYINRYRSGMRIKPNKSELMLQSILDQYFPNIYRYVGDFSVVIGGKCPDFININGKKEVIELFGMFYHKYDDVEATIGHYKNYGFSCIVIWEIELKETSRLVEHICSGIEYIPREILSLKTITDYTKAKPRRVIKLNGNKFIEEQI